MKNNYHTREGYEQLLKNILRETQKPIPKDIYTISDIKLLTLINHTLHLNHCFVFNHNEVEDILDALA